ncbi:serine/threonine-protein kinase ZRK1-like [Euphorbia lathyris]|uniref:serine/threonine-protein kinase ZRK1-like n=1 Tax=Euphorbia lathyris TaxID=212925 RepID=UPI003313F92B
MILSAVEKMFSCLTMGKKAQEETPFMKNGRMLLEELIASCNGKCNHIRTFSSQELNRATNNYHHEQMIFRDSGYTVYKGFLEDRRPITIKRYSSFWENTDYREFRYLLESAMTDIVIGTQMSVHKNVLKLIGCCLDFEFPILVYEFVGNCTLSNRIGKYCSKPLSWKCRIRIAADIAYAVAYLHTALSRLVVLRDIRPSTVILDQDNVAKLTDFSLSVSIPDGESHVITGVFAKTGYLPLEYLNSGYVTEKLDVFYFGLLLLHLLTGNSTFFKVNDLDYVSPYEHLKQCVENQELIKIVDPDILKDVEQQQIVDVGTLALSCICNEAEGRPTMTDITKQLWRIHRSLCTML